MKYQDLRVTGIRTGLTAIGRVTLVVETGVGKSETREALVAEMDPDYLTVIWPETRLLQRVEWRRVVEAEVELW